MLMLKLNRLKIFVFAFLLTLVFSVYGIAQTLSQSGSVPNTPSGITSGDIKDWATIGVLLTAAISFLKTTVERFYKQPLTELQKTVLSGIICVAAAVFYSIQNGYFTDLDVRNLSSIVAAIGVVSTITKVFYDGITNPLLKALTHTSNSPSEKSADTLKTVLVTKGVEEFKEAIDKVSEKFSNNPKAEVVIQNIKTPEVLESIENLAKDTAKTVVISEVEKQLGKHFDKLFNRLDSTVVGIPYTSEPNSPSVSDTVKLTTNQVDDEVEVDPTANVVELLKDDSEVYDYASNPS